MSQKIPQLFYCLIARENTILAEFSLARGNFA